MGRRISMRMIIGVDDFKGDADERLVKPIDPEWFYEAEIDMSCDETLLAAGREWGHCTKEPPVVDISKLVYMGCGDYGFPNLLGVVIEELPYAALSLYALAINDERFMAQEYFEVGKYAKDSTYMRIHKPNYVDPERAYKFGLDRTLTMYLDPVMLILEKVGFNVKRENLRLFLEWHWS